MELETVSERGSKNYSLKSELDELDWLSKVYFQSTTITTLYWIVKYKDELLTKMTFFFFEISETISTHNIVTVKVKGRWLILEKLGKNFPLSINTEINISIIIIINISLSLNREKIYG